MSDLLQTLGLSQEELQERVIDKICESFLSTTGFDEDGSYEMPSNMQRILKDHITKNIKEQVERLGNIHVIPKINDYVENLVITKTNSYGEKSGETMTFIEYLVKAAEDYMIEPVNHTGKAKHEDSYSWHKSTTRIAYMVDKHLQYSIETAMKQALQTANSAIANGINEAVKIKLNEVVNGIKVSVATK
jgi:hypothetical protein